MNKGKVHNKKGGHWPGSTFTLLCQRKYCCVYNAEEHRGCNRMLQEVPELDLRTLESTVPPASWHLPWSCPVLYTKGTEGCKDILPGLWTKVSSTKMRKVSSAIKERNQTPTGSNYSGYPGESQNLDCAGHSLKLLLWLHPSWFLAYAIKWPKNSQGEQLHALDPNSYWTLWKIWEACLWLIPGSEYLSLQCQKFLLFLSVPFHGADFRVKWTRTGLYLLPHWSHTTEWVEPEGQIAVGMWG